MSSLSAWRDDPRFFHSLCTSWRPPPQQNLVSQTTFASASLGAVATDMCSRRALRRRGRCRALPPAHSPGSVTDRRPGSSRGRGGKGGSRRSDGLAACVVSRWRWNVLARIGAVVLFFFIIISVSSRRCLRRPVISSSLTVPPKRTD